MRNINYTCSTSHKVFHHPGYILLFGVLFLIFLSGCTVTLMGDVTPPAEVQSTQVPLITPIPTSTLTGGDNQPAATLEPGKVAICVYVHNGSSGRIPKDLTISLKGYDGQQIVMQTSHELGGTYDHCFTSVEYKSDRQYLAETDYNGIVFQSQTIEGADITTGGIASLLITIYDTTKDMSTLEIERAHFFLDFSGTGRSMQVIQLFMISNHGQYAVIPLETGEPLLYFDLPQSAYNLALEGGNLGKRFIKTQFGFGDTQPILPGMSEHQVLYTYELPYDNQAQISLTLPLPVNSVVVAIPSQGVELESEQLTDSGTRVIQGINMRLYKATDLTAGQYIDMMISGWPPNVRPPGGRSLSNLIIGLSSFLVSLNILVFWLIIKTRNLRLHTAVQDEEIKMEILDAIITLDDLHRSDEIPDNAYHARRAHLKEQLRQIVSKTGK